MVVGTNAGGDAELTGVVQLGHARWTIANEGFNELVTRWHAAHVYRHERPALLAVGIIRADCAT